jgi:hypothetical protein
MKYTRGYCEVRIGLDGTTITEDTGAHCDARKVLPDDIVVEITDIDGSVVGVPVQRLVDAWFKVNRGIDVEPEAQEARPVEPGAYGKVMIKEGWNGLLDRNEWVADLDYPGHARRYGAFRSYVDASRFVEKALSEMWTGNIEEDGT